MLLGAEEGILMTRGFRIAHLVVVSVVLAGIVVQPFLIGLFLFGAVHNADLHTIVGYTLFEFGAPLLLIAALLARLPRREMLLTLLLIVDIFVQIVLVNAPRRERLQRAGRAERRRHDPRRPNRSRQGTGRARPRLLASTPVDLCVTTNFQRSFETADIVLAGRDVPRLLVEQLSDPPNGDLELRPYAELEAWRATNGPEAHLPGTGRTLRDYFETIRQGTILVVSRPEASVLAVIHGLAISWLLKSVGLSVPVEQAVPVFIAPDDLDAMIEATGDDVSSSGLGKTDSSTSSCCPTSTRGCGTP